MTRNLTTSNSVRIERVFDAPVQMLWQIFTEPDLIKLWFGGDPNGTVQSAVIDLKVGGRHEVIFSDSNGTSHTAFGDFLLIETNSRLHYSWQWLSEPGHISEVEVQFISLGDQTKVILLHKNLHPESRHGYQQGWNGAFDKVERVVNSKTLTNGRIG